MRLDNIYFFINPQHKRGRVLRAWSPFLTSPVFLLGYSLYAYYGK